TAPANPVASPSCQLPAGSQSGSGYQTGQGYRPAGKRGGTIPLVNGSGFPASGKGHAQSRLHANPANVPVIVIGKGMAISSRSHSEVSSRKLTSTAWQKNTAQPARGTSPAAMADRCTARYGRS